MIEGWSAIIHASNNRVQERMHWFLPIKGMDDTQQTVCGKYLHPREETFMEVDKCGGCVRTLGKK